MRALTLLIAVTAVAGCGGGGGEKDAERVLRDFAKAVNEADGKTLCGELVTREYLEEVTFAKGEAAVEQCERQIDALKQETFKIAAIEKTEIEGDDATVTARIQTQGRRVPQVFRLTKEDGEFRVTGSRP